VVAGSQGCLSPHAEARAAVVRHGDLYQGDLYWYDPGAPRGSESAYRRPHVVIQSDRFNRSAIRTAVICALTSNLGHRRIAGNVFVPAGEGGLPRDSVVQVSQLLTVDKSELEDLIGRLPRVRIQEVLAGVALVLGLPRA